MDGNTTLQAQHDALLLDLDGTVWEGGRAIPHAVEAINASGCKAIYITNNASRAASRVAAMLQDIGLNAAEADVLTSAQAALGLAEDVLEPGDPVLVLGAQPFKDLVRDAGYQVTDSADAAPKAVLHGHNPDTGWAELSEAALAIRTGAVYLASNMDTTLPMERGLMVGNGSMIAAVTSATGVTPRSAGKPEPAMFHQAAERFGAKSPLGIGDRLDTDLAGGVAAGMPTLHVLTGVSGPLALLQAPPQQRPTYIGEDMRALAAEPATLRPGAQGGFQARMEGDELVVDGGEEASTSVQALRTALEVAWAQPTGPRNVRAVSTEAEAALAKWW
ncbi:HAD-IIA family hydrolase [Corynebacterium godavarianum]|uniref:HAD-IIA family hydrolase n=1 Tax=Corynebacterium godavarianum TaxID=2054421 RepID=A0ABY3E7R0_9CORY|nr:HAD-IIA family hydrolase [Corynebacterium godavarianum]MBL7285869.1 HAD-IIA family hydrolase [Corynebacterium godavarianum]TSJ76037.1 HAD-IIA family hydrolase [Corynebacterium godavarianum]